MVGEVLEHYEFEDKVDNIIPFGDGHINDTFRLKTASRDYILQRINHEIFSNIQAISSTMIQLDKIFHSGINRYIEIPKLKRSIDQSAVVNVKNTFWRIYEFCSGTVSYNIVPKFQMLESAGLAFGRFIEALGTSSPFETVLPGFQDLPLRIEQLKGAMASTEYPHRLEETESLVNFVFNHFETLEPLLTSLPALPIRNIHNDTKINNLLFDKKGNAKYVVDLDTVMPGYLHFDFGDALRTVATDVPEDSPRLTDMKLSDDRIESFTRGFLIATRELRTSQETASLHWAPNYMSFIMGVRFLSDYIQGDTYYKTTRDKQNLDRARNQLHLAKLWDAYATNLAQMIGKFSNSTS